MIDLWKTGDVWYPDDEDIKDKPVRYSIASLIEIASRTGRVKLTEEHERLLASCYESCLKLADVNGLKSIAFCCISTGVFMFPNQRAAKIAVKTVREYRSKYSSEIEVIFNVWKDIDYEIYRKLLG